MYRRAAAVSMPTWSSPGSTSVTIASSTTSRPSATPSTLHECREVGGARPPPPRFPVPSAIRPATPKHDVADLRTKTGGAIQGGALRRARSSSPLEVEASPHRRPGWSRWFDRSCSRREREREREGATASIGTPTSTCARPRRRSQRRCATVDPDARKRDSIALTRAAWARSRAGRSGRGVISSPTLGRGDSHRG